MTSEFIDHGFPDQTVNPAICPNFGRLVYFFTQQGKIALRHYLRAKELNAELLRSQRLEQNVLHDMCYSVVLWAWILFNQSRGQK